MCISNMRFDGTSSQLQGFQKLCCSWVSEQSRVKLLCQWGRREFRWYKLAAFKECRIPIGSKIHLNSNTGESAKNWTLSHPKPCPTNRESSLIWARSRSSLIETTLSIVSLLTYNSSFDITSWNLHSWWSNTKWILSAINQESP